MNAKDFIEKFNKKSREYITMNGIQVMDKDGNPIQEIIFDIENNKIILK